MNTVCRLSDRELTKIQPLFAQVFGASISEAMLDWKYAQGRGESWCVYDQSHRLLLHCGICFREVFRFGKEERVAQLVDLMAAPKQAGLSRKGAAFSVLMCEILAGLRNPRNPESVAFGFPSERAMRLGELSGVYCSVDNWMELSFCAKPFLVSPSIEFLSHENTTWDSSVDRLWSDMRDSFRDAVIGNRNSAYLRFRYFARPDRQYVLLLMKSSIFRRPFGLAVLSLSSGHCEIMDLIAAKDNIADVIAGVQNWLKSQKINSLSLLITEGFCGLVSLSASAVSKTQFKIMANPFMRSSELAALKGRWWLTGGDTDYR